MVEALLKEWDGEELVIRYDRPTGAWIIIAIHSTKLGPSGGGTRMKQYPDLDAAVRDAMRLSDGMTHKYASVNFPYGGAKAVLAIPPGLDPEARKGLLRRYGSVIHALGGLYCTGPDVGTTSADMDTIGETAGTFALCQAEERGGAGDPGPYTALGVFEGMRTTCQHAFGSPDMKGVRVVVQGTGDVGGPLINRLHEAGAQLLIADISQERLASFGALDGVEVIPADGVIETACDVFAPCALGAVLNQETIPRLACKVVAGSANNQLDTPEDAQRLRDRGILYAPDYVINAGGAVAIWGIERLGWPPAEAGPNLVDLITSGLRHIFETADAEGITTNEAANRVVAQRLEHGVS